ncbi:5'-methylthioadenosine/S-adenosylhomocysteine nucleosidase family protein [Allokutzneria oryzae]|uniref:Nucleoside phosphorylase domain-containing protein n=1 Tax=Allokutzneria oryzae TaxID=1378989 RepID=A0ABV6A961_9PSEU
MIEQAARRLPRTNEWHGLLPAEGRALTPAVHFEPIAAGDVVLNSRTSPVAERLRRNYNDAVAVDMEDAEFAKAGHLNEWIPLAAVRGISDVAGGERAKTDDEADDGSEESNRPPSPRIHNTSIAKGKAQVGQQSGVNFGAFYQGRHRAGGDAEGLLADLLRSGRGGTELAYYCALAERPGKGSPRFRSV